MIKCKCTGGFCPDCGEWVEGGSAPNRIKELEQDFDEMCERANELEAQLKVANQFIFNLGKGGQ